MRGAAIAIAVLAVGRAEPARASCGGGESSSSTSSSDSSSSSAPTCHDTTDIHGYRECTQFGAWGANLRMPAIVVELGTAVRTFSAAPGDRLGSVTHETESFAFRAVGPAMANPIDTAVVSTLRLGIALPHHTYAALDGELGGLVDQAGGSRVEMTTSGALGTPSIEQSYAMVSSVLGTAGIGGAVGRARIGVELAGGARAVTYAYHSQYLACEQTDTITDVAPVLEARARAALWVTPFLTVGATAGTSLIDRGAWVGGIQLGFTSRAFGGGR